MPNQQLVADLAGQLWEAGRARVPIESLTDRHPGLEVDDGYAQPLDIAMLIHPRAEPEIAFLLARELAGPTTVTGVLAATEAVFGAVDVLDSRYRDFRFTLPDVVADNASAGRLFLGPRACRPGQIEDLRLIGCVLRCGGEVIHTAAGAAVMGHPAASVAWLANRLAEHGEHLPAGSLVFSGGLTAAVPIRPGHAVTAEFDGLGTVEVFAPASEWHRQTYPSRKA